MIRGIVAAILIGSVYMQLVLYKFFFRMGDPRTPGLTHLVCYACR